MTNFCFTQKMQLNFGDISKITEERLGDKGKAAGVEVGSCMVTGKSMN